MADAGALPEVTNTGLLPIHVIDAHLVSRPDLVRYNPNTGEIDEICTMIVNGRLFEDWETVWIQWNWNDWFSRFRFTCAEPDDYPLTQTSRVMRLAPQDEVKIYLGGILVITGIIVARQVVYDKDMHGVQLEGYSASWFAQRSSIEHKTHDFDGKSFLEIAGEVLRPTGVGYETVGNITSEKYKSGATPGTGETIGQFLERLARDKKIIVSNTPHGDFLFIGEHAWPAIGELVEGINIKKMQCTITDEYARSMFNTLGQKQGTDESHGKDASEQEAKVKGILRRYSIITTAMEQPVASIAEVMRRNDTEKMWNEDLTKIEANVTVYGWFRPRPTTLARENGDPASFMMGYAPSPVLQNEASFGHILWQAGDEVVVKSPMALLNNEQLKIRTVTWTQDRQSGTQTLLQLVNPLGLNGAAPIKTPRSVADSDPAETPASQYDPLIGPG